MREHGVPFRIGHHFASSMVGLARKAGFTPLNFPYDEAVRLYREEIEKEFPKASPVFPMNEADLQSALDPCQNDRRQCQSHRGSENARTAL